jgi:hypothetical protein
VVNPAGNGPQGVCDRRLTVSKWVCQLARNLKKCFDNSRLERDAREKQDDVSQKGTNMGPSNSQLVRLLHTARKFQDINPHRNFVLLLHLDFGHERRTLVCWTLGGRMAGVCARVDDAMMGFVGFVVPRECMNGEESCDL